MNKKSLHTLMRFGINGLIMTIGAYVLIRLLLVFGMGYILASVIGYIIMVFVNYLLSAGFVFRSKRSFKNLMHFLVSQGLAFLIFTAVNSLLYSLGLDKNLCFLIAIIFSTSTNFFYNNFITFRK